MSDKLKELIERAKRVAMTAADREEQRRSFAYGNTKIENDLITRETIDRQAEQIKPPMSSDDDRHSVAETPYLIEDNHYPQNLENP